MKRIPLLPTIAVVLAAAIMLALGVWQLDRRAEKQGLLARLEANRNRPVMALPVHADDTALFRRVTFPCRSVAGWQTTAGRTADGTTGWRHLADCRMQGAEGPKILVDMGTGTDPMFRPRWPGGTVTGTLTRAPSQSTVLDQLLGRGAAPGRMVVAETPAAGLNPSRQPSPADVPNNHLGYAIQWFFFAAAALVIYALALRRRSGTRRR